MKGRDWASSGENSAVKISISSSLKIKFNQTRLDNFWSRARGDYPGLSNEARRVLISFLEVLLLYTLFRIRTDENTSLFSASIPATAVRMFAD